MTEEKLADLKQFTVNRTSLVTTTETTYVYNRGRLISYKENGFDHVQFMAIMDLRTSVQCKSRQGLVMRMDDSRLADNTPPLHGRCRSLLRLILARTDRTGAAGLGAGRTVAQGVESGLDSAGNMMVKSFIRRWNSLDYYLKYLELLITAQKEAGWDEKRHERIEALCDQIEKELRIDRRPK